MAMLNNQRVIVIVCSCHCHCYCCDDGGVTVSVIVTSLGLQYIYIQFVCSELHNHTSDPVSES